jgi:CRISPR-associated endoribonuclease Cas6
MKKGLPMTTETAHGPLRAAPHLPLARYRLDFRARDTITLPPFQGALWRGVFGKALKGLCGEARADGANEPGLYDYFVETPPPADATKMRRYDAAPHPYVLGAEPNFEPRHFAPGDMLTIELALIGRGNAHAPAVFEAFARAGEGGLGKSRGRAALSEVHAIWRGDALDLALTPGPDGRYRGGVPAESPAIPPAPEAVEVYLLTPLRLVHEGRTVGPNAFRPADLLRALIRRISMLMTFHTAADLEADFKLLTALAHGARMAEPRLEMAKQQRWSGTQKDVIQMDGLIGSFLLHMRGLTPLWPYLWLGQWVHAGKGTVHGLGALHVREALDG